MANPISWRSVHHICETNRQLFKEIMLGSDTKLRLYICNQCHPNCSVLGLSWYSSTDLLIHNIYYSKPIGSDYNWILSSLSMYFHADGRKCLMLQKNKWKLTTLIVIITFVNALTRGLTVFSKKQPCLMSLP